MDSFNVLHYLASARNQLYREEIERAGIAALLERGLTREDNPLLPVKLASGLSDEKELELRRLDAEEVRRRIDELQAHIESMAEEMKS